MKISFSKNSWYSLAGIILIVAVWEFAARNVGSNNILPGPLLCIKTLVGLITETDFYRNLGLTLLRGLTGFALALSFSLIIGIPSGLNRKTGAFFSPILVTIRSTPVISIILLAIIWFRVESVPVFIGFLTMFPILTTNLSSGLKDVDPGLIVMARVYRVNNWRILKDVYLPSILPFLFSGLLTAAGFGWRAVIIGEVLSQPKFGIGSMMQDAQSYLLVAELISWTMVAVAVGFIFEKSIAWIEGKTIRWK